MGLLKKKIQLSDVCEIHPSVIMGDFQAMEEEESSSGDSNHNKSVTPNFEFAFNSINFSDRILRIEIVADEEKEGLVFFFFFFSFDFLGLDFVFGRVLGID